ncbi:MAG: hypothetical protein RH917_09275 [Lacipirellulaceae bacterium]
MPRSPLAALTAVFTTASFFLMAGCTEPAGMSTADLKKYRTSFTLSEDPEGAMSVLDVREALTGEPLEEDHNHDAEEAEHDEEGHDHEDADHDHEEHDHADHDRHGHDGHDHHAHAVEGGKEIVLVGSVGGLANPWKETEPAFPFSKEHAVLYVVDSAELQEYEAHEHNHAPGEECAFCAAHAGDQSKLMARVEFKGKDGKLLTVPTQKLFELKEKETVVVKGTARIAPGGTLVVEADGLYVRK